MIIKSRLDKCFLGKTLVLSDGNTEIGVTLEVGPRIILLRKVGGQNIMFEDLDDEVNKDVSSVYGEGERWHIYGGHRIWISPEELKTYYPDNHPVSYELTDRGAIFTPNVWRVHDVQTSLKIEFCDDGSMDVTMSLANVGKEPKELCIWGLSVLKCGGKLTLPLSTKDTGLLANRNIVMWSYSSFNDERLTIKDDEIILKSETKATKPFKLGIFTEDLQAKYEIGDTTFIKKMSADQHKNYVDFCCNVETYTSNLIHEVETLSPIETVAPSGILEHKENWTIK